MARATSEKVGRGACPDCGEPVMYRRSSGGMLCHKCEMCDSSGYAAPGGEAYRKRMATIKAPAPEAAPKAAEAPAPKAAPTPPPAPAKRVPNSVFSLGDL